jgi:membrane associated rhomboid family serine protease
MLDDRSYMREPPRQYWSMTTVLLVSLVVCFVVQMILERVMGIVLDAGSGRMVSRFDQLFALSLEGMRRGWYWQLITFQFMHGGFLHILGNMLGLYFFGRAVEEMLGPRGMLKLYLLSGTLGGLCHVALCLAFPAYFYQGVVGASAGVFGLIAAFAVSAPEQPITMLVYFFFPVTFKAKWFLIIEAVLAVGGLFMPGAGGVAHGAHLGGMLTGIAFIKWSGWLGRAGAMWRPVTRRRPARELVGASAQRASRRVGQTVEDLPPAEYISREVDPILEKISAQGIHSLTDRERQILEAARNKMARR